MYIRTTGHKPVRPFLSAVVLLWAIVITGIMVLIYHGAHQGEARFLNPGGERSGERSGEQSVRDTVRDGASERPGPGSVSGRGSTRA
ncbi:MAG: hypothetical protein WD049_10130 [Candidatus Paceibacterota bacterium]